MREFIIWPIAMCLLISGCVTAQQHATDVEGAFPGKNLTVGLVQGEIKQGMSGAEVANVLGSPNIVTSDKKGEETWVYDKISTTTVYSNSSGGVNSLIFGGGGSVAGFLAADAEYGSGASMIRQQTLTIIINYDENKKVRDFSYHSSKF